jgi:aconitate hydratase
MRSVAARMKRNPKVIEPLVPVDLVVDHSVQIDHYGSANVLDLNMKLEFSRNRERYQFMKWGMQAFDTFKVVPPGFGIVHQVNLEYLGRGVFNKDGVYYPDTLVGTDSHTTMINGIGVVAWGVGGIEAEAGMLGQPVYFLTPDVVGVNLTGKAREGVTATDVVLTVTEMLRKAKVVGKFVEFFGTGAATLSAPDRATIANMAPEYGATMGFFPVDDKTVDYFRSTGRSAESVSALEAYFKAQGLFGMPQKGDIDYTEVLELDLDTVRASLAGPKRPQDRIELGALKSTFSKLFSEPVPKNGFAKKPEDLGARFTTKDGVDIGSGDVLIAAITSCTNTSNPSVLIAAGLLAKKAVERGLTVKPHIKTSLAPGSRVVTDYLTASGLLPYLEKVGFYVSGYGCTTCIGNAGPLAEPIEQTVVEKDLVCAAVLSGNRNFEARIHPNIRANFLASPPLVVAYAIAGTVLKDLEKEPVGQGKDGPVFLRDIWPTSQEVADLMRFARDPAVFQRLYGDVTKDNPLWQEIPATTGQVYNWPKSTYIAEPPFFEAFGMSAGKAHDIKGARVLGIFGDSVTTDHISPAGSIKDTSPAGKYLIANGVPKVDFNSYGARRGNHEVMMRGTFANVRIKNLMIPPKADGTRLEGGVTGAQALGRRDVDLRRRDALHPGRHADRDLRRRGVRHGLIPRLGGEGHAAPRREGGLRAQLRAHPPLEPRRHGRPAPAVQGHGFRRHAEDHGRRGHRRRRPREWRPAADGRDARDPPQGRHHEGSPRAAADRHADRGGLLPPRRNPAVRAARAGGAGNDREGYGVAGTRTQPSIRRRALRLITARATFHSPASRVTSAPTAIAPEEWPRRVRSGSAAGRRAAFTTVPSMAAATAVAMAPVPVIAWWSFPIDSIRIVRSMSPSAIALPLDDV